MYLGRAGFAQYLSLSDLDFIMENAQMQLKCLSCIGKYHIYLFKDYDLWVVQYNDSKFKAHTIIKTISFTQAIEKFKQTIEEIIYL